jgi:tight adherence protein B
VINASSVVATLLLAGCLLAGCLLLVPPPSRRRLAALTSRRRLSNSLLHKGIAGVVAGLALLTMVGLTATCLAVGAGVAVAWAVTRARARQAAATTRLAVVELLRAVAGELRSGHPPSGAFAAAAEAADRCLQPMLAPLAGIAIRGDADELAHALQMAASSGQALAGLSRFAACWQVAASSGAALAPAIDRVADALHDEIVFGRSLSASLAGPRATVRLLAVLPLVGLGLGGVLGARPLAFLLGGPAGLGCLVVAIGFDAVGVFWGRRIARGAAVFDR